MKRVGTLTFHRSINYGSVLQAYALQKFLQKSDFLTEIIDYEPDNYKYLYGMFRFPKNKNDIKYDIANLRLFNLYITRNHLFREFRNKALSLSISSYVYGDDLTVLDDRYDAVVVGSDQVWNPKAKDSDINFFLPFLNKTPKIAYAISMNDGFASVFPNSGYVHRLLMDFKEISVREDAGKKDIEKFLNNLKKVEVTLDPTLLLSREDYDVICGKQCPEKPYIFLYSVFHRKEVIDAAEVLSRRTGLKIYTLYTNYQSFHTFRSNKDIRFLQKNVGPGDFLAMIANAEYVVTDSFHGTAFSIIYEKEFFSIGRCNEQRKKMRDERVCGILEQLNIQERYVSSEELSQYNLNSKIDYTKVIGKKDELAQQSRNYLLNALK